MTQAQVDAQTVSSRARGGEALENVAADMDLEVRTAGPFSRMDFVPGIGRQNAAIGAAFGLAPGEISGPVSTPVNAFVIQVVSRTEADPAAWRAQIAEQRQAVIGARQQVRLQEWIEALRGAARIVDRRDVVLAPQDEADLPQMPMVF
jgi:hypothetical protein